MDDVLCSLFHLNASFEWRWPEPYEKMYHRPEDGYVGIWLEHLRFGFHPRNHQFLKNLCKYEYGIPAYYAKYFEGLELGVSLSQGA